MKKKTALISAHPAVIAVWAALMAAAALLPAIPIIGTGSTFSISDCLVPLAGIFFGPITGAIAAGVGGFVSQLIAPHTVLFGPLQFTIAMVGALGAGFAMQRKWIVPFAIITVFGLAWYLFPLGRDAWPTPLLYILGYIFIFIGWWIGRKEDPLLSKNRARMSLGIFCCAIAGIVVTQSIGNLWALIAFQLPREVWYSVLAIAPVQRVLFSLGSMIIGVPLLIGLVKIGIFVGPIIYQKEEDAEPVPADNPTPLA